MKMSRFMPDCIHMDSGSSVGAIYLCSIHGCYGTYVNIWYEHLG